MTLPPITGDMPENKQDGDIVARRDAWLIVKRDLFYRPNAEGYTGIRDHAGRYTLDEVAARYPNKDHANQDGITFVHEDDAPEFTTACYHDLKAAHLMKQRDEARAQAASAEAALREMLEYSEWATKVGGVCPSHLVGCNERARAALTPAQTEGGGNG